MGFLDRFKGKQEAADEAPEPTDKATIIGQKDVGAWISEQKKRVKAKLSEANKPVFERLPRVLNEIEEANKRLSEDPGKQNVEGRVKSIVVGSRDNYVKAIEKELEAIRAAVEEGPLKAHSQLAASLANIKDTDRRHGQRAYFGFEKSMNDLKKKLNGLVGISKASGEIVSSEKDRLAVLAEASKEAESLKALEERLEVLEGRSRELEEKLDAETADAASTRTRLQEAESGQEASDFARLGDELETLKGEISSIETKVLNAIGPFKRALKKYQRAAESGNYPPGRVSAFIEEPIDAFLKGPGESSGLDELLKNLKRAAEDDALGLDGNENNKVIARLGQLDMGALEGLKRKYGESMRTRSELKRRLEELDVAKHVKDLKNSLASIESRIGEIKSAQGRAESEAAELKAEIKKGYDKIGAVLSRFKGGKVGIAFGPG